MNRSRESGKKVLFQHIAADKETHIGGLVFNVYDEMVAEMETPPTTEKQRGTKRKRDVESLPKGIHRDVTLLDFKVRRVSLAFRALNFIKKEKKKNLKI